jgi:hypothetical protein
MSMVLAMCTLSDENVRQVLADPPLIWKVIAPDDPEPYDNERQQRPAGFLSRLFGGKAAPPPPADLKLDEVSHTDLDKAWHGIHYMLTRTAWEGDPPLNFILLGGSEVGKIDVGYGPARVFSSAQVQALHGALAPIGEAFLRSRFDPSAMMKLEIYPEIWDRDPAEDDTFGYCAGYFTTLKEFVATAAERRLGLVFYLS